MMRWMKHFTAVVMVGVFIFSIPGFTHAKQSKPSKIQEESQPFIPPESQPLNGGEKHTYPLPLKANDYVKLVVSNAGLMWSCGWLGQMEKSSRKWTARTAYRARSRFPASLSSQGATSLKLKPWKKLPRLGSMN
ncbi:MAG: hypothetical protein HY774_27535 [Acidobacteria bacterium]|nr:hypothetical protein [Acidobacteriota bacterium]